MTLAMETNQVQSTTNANPFLSKSALCPVCHGNRVVSWIKPGRSAIDPYAYGEYEPCQHCLATGSVPACPCGDPAREDEAFCSEDCAEEYGCQQRPDGPEDGKCCKPITSIVAEPYTPAGFQTECCDDCAKSLVDFGYRRVA